MTRLMAHDKTAANDVRLFMMPGVEHCWGGPGPSYTNFLAEIDKWVETGKAPEQTAAYWLDEKFQPNRFKATMRLSQKWRSTMAKGIHT